MKLLLIFLLALLPLRSTTFTIHVILLKANTNNAFRFSSNYQTGYIGNQRIFDVFDDGLYFAHHRLLTGDTTRAYLYKFIAYTPNEATLYAYSDLGNNKTFISWFNEKNIRWMSGHECTCTNIILEPATTDKYSGIKCNF